MAVFPITFMVLNGLLIFLMVATGFLIIAAIVLLYEKISNRIYLERERERNDSISKERLTKDMLDELYKAIEEIDYSKLDTNLRLIDEMLQNVGALVRTLSKCKKRMW